MLVRERIGIVGTRKTRNESVGNEKIRSKRFV
jgi:hypothetical protein